MKVLIYLFIPFLVFLDACVSTNDSSDAISCDSLLISTPVWAHTISQDQGRTREKLDMIERSSEILSHRPAKALRSALERYLNDPSVDEFERWHRLDNAYIVLAFYIKRPISNRTDYFLKMEPDGSITIKEPTLLIFTSRGNYYYDYKWYVNRYFREFDDEVKRLNNPEN